MRPIGILSLLVSSITAVSAASTAVSTTFLPSAATLARSTTSSSLPSFVMATPTGKTTSAPDPIVVAETSAAAAKTFTVQVGNGDHKFKPDVIQAEVGDVVEFNFYPQNHSVIRAEYEHPCIPYEMTGKGKTGFWSGFKAVDAVLDEPPSYSVKVNNTAPVFFYCSAPDSCTKQGMVGVINPNANTSLAHQRSLALEASYQLSPGEDFPTEAETPSSSSTPLPSGPSASPASTSSHKLGGGAIAGITIACLAVVALAGLLLWFWGRFKGLRDEVERKDSTVVRSTAPRNTWYLTHSPGSHASPLWSSPSPSAPQTQTQTQTQQQHASPPYSVHTPSPGGMTSHAVPPAYYDSQFSYRAASPLNRSPGGMSRAASHRSVGGTFAFSPVTGRYTRDDDWEHDYFAHHADLSAAHHAAGPITHRTSDMTSPVDPGMRGAARTGVLSDLQRLARSPERRDESYPDEKGRRVGEHVNRDEAPAEMEDTSAGV